jgi:hypothetical protein
MKFKEYLKDAVLLIISIVIGYAFMYFLEYKYELIWIDIIW